MAKRKRVAQLTVEAKQQQVEQFPTAPSADKNIPIFFKNPKQAATWDLMAEKRIIFLIGPAGTAKTFLATAFAAYCVLYKKSRKLYLTRPAVVAEEDVGHLPGELDEKLKPYMIPIMESAEQIFHERNVDHKKLIEAIELVPLGFSRGRTFRNAICLLDEAQNLTSGQLKLYLTRIGRQTKMIITGDPEQSDIHNSALMSYVNALKASAQVGVMTFTESDSVRDPIIPEILTLTKNL